MTKLLHFVYISDWYSESAQYLDGESGKQVMMVTHFKEQDTYTVHGPGMPIAEYKMQKLAEGIARMWLMSKGYTSITKRSRRA